MDIADVDNYSVGDDYKFSGNEGSLIVGDVTFDLTKSLSLNANLNYALYTGDVTQKSYKLAAINELSEKVTFEGVFKAKEKLNCIYVKLSATL